MDENTQQDQPANPETDAPENDTPAPTEAPAEAPAEQAAAPTRSRARKGAVAAQPSKVLGEDEDEKFDPVAHGKQTALENHQAASAE